MLVRFKEKAMKQLGLLLAVLILAGCSTFQGLGKDIQKGGAVIEKAANK
jgi:predicted small secreted protein